MFLCITCNLYRLRKASWPLLNLNFCFTFTGLAMWHHFTIVSLLPTVLYSVLQPYHLSPHITQRNPHFFLRFGMIWMNSGTRWSITSCQWWGGEWRSLVRSTGSGGTRGAPTGASTASSASPCTRTTWASRLTAFGPRQRSSLQRLTESQYVTVDVQYPVGYTGDIDIDFL